ncbi:MAG: dihydropteroate synthase [Methanomicrobiaceae archaeon]|nr:dihydropteroate synthase [Methanomicrobiaceae archaeon]
MPNCKIDKITVGGNNPVSLMGVVNCSPESFFSGSYTRPEGVYEKAASLIEDGADIIDIGARSTAPLSAPITVAEETERMKTALSEFSGSGIPVSVDTMYPEVLEMCIRYDISCINDIHGLANEKFAKIAGDSGLPAILMATYLEPGDPVGFDAVRDALNVVSGRAEKHGIEDIILDPAVGRWTPARTSENDWEICRRFKELKITGRPLLAAVSRKTFIGELVNAPPEGRLAGTLAVTYSLLVSGASMIRAHDISETRNLIDVFAKLNY